MGQAERYVEGYLVKLAKKLDLLVFKFTSPGINGVPDRMLVNKKGEIIFIETKAYGEKPRKLQQVIIKKMRNYKLKVYVIDNREDIKKTLTTFAE